MTDPRTYSDLLQEGASLLREARLARPRLEAEVLLAHVAGLRREELYTRGEERPTQPVLAAYAAALGRRASHEPLAYIVGHKEFMSLDFEVTPAVIVPRPETELLVETARRFLAARAAPRAIDVGTGSGVVGLTLARLLPELRLWALDVSPEAVRVARRNAERLGVSGRVEILVSDLLSSPGLPPQGTVDTVVANLPYVRSGVLSSLAPEVATFEPRLALDGGTDGLRIIGRLLPQAWQALMPGGACGLECDPEQCTLLTEHLHQAGFERTEVHRDLAGRGRVVWGVKGGQADPGALPGRA